MAPNLADPIVTQIAAEDKIKWYRKPNLRRMYLVLFCCCMGVEMTSGFDSQLINVLQFSAKWNKCKSGYLVSSFDEVLKASRFLKRLQRL